MGTVVVTRGHLGVVTWLLARKVSIDDKLLTNAVIYDHVVIIGVLINDGYNAGWVDCDCDKETLLHVAARHGSLACLRVLIKAGLGVNSPTNTGMKPLDCTIVGSEERVGIDEHWVNGGGEQWEIEEQ